MLSSRTTSRIRPHTPIGARRGVRQIVAASTIAVAGLSLSACGSDSGSGDGDGGVVVGFYPLEYLASSIAGDKLDVENLAQPGAEPHDMELTAKQIGSVSAASLVVYEKGLQPALDDAIANEKPDNTLDVATVTTLMDGYEGAHEHEGEGEHGADESGATESGATESGSAESGSAATGADESEADEHGADEHAHEEESTLDPHIWLDPKLMVTMAEAIKDKLVDVDEKNKSTYEKNFEDVKAKLEGLDESFTKGLATCQRKAIVTTHNAFGYLAKAYGLEQVGIAGLSEEEPSPQKLAEVKQYVQDNGVTTIFFEEAVSDKYAKTVASETGAQTAVLSPLEVKPESGDYISAMETNLEALRTALSCS